MNAFLWIVISVSVAATIGGFTNYMAIKMLFHPRHPVIIKGKRVPFTPGLIPKRKEEIASSLGSIVGEHLVTSRGLRSVLHSPKIKQQLEGKLSSWIRQLCESERTLEEELLRFVTYHQLEMWKYRLNKLGKKSLLQCFHWLRKHYELDSKSVKQWLSLLPESEVEAWKKRGAELLIRTIREELHSIRGERLIKQAIEQFLRQQTGFFGALAGAVVDVQRVTWRIQDALVDVLSSPQTVQYVEQTIDSKLQVWQEKTFPELIVELTGEDPFVWIEENVLSRVEPIQLFERLLNQPLHRLIGRWQQPLKKQVPAIAAWTLEKAGTELERIVAAFDLPALVQSEVNTFPIERVEQVILNVTGREFRAITWLGAVIGGVIGLVQAVFYITVGHI